MLYVRVLLWDNGYSCGCCRNEWKETEEFEADSDEEALELSKSYVSKPIPDYGVELINLYRIEKKIYG